MSDPSGFKKDLRSLERLQHKPTKKKDSMSPVALVSVGGLLAAVVAFSLFANQTGPVSGESIETSSAQIADSVAATVTAVVVASESANATADASKCFVTPLEQYPNVGVRRSPEVSDTNLIRALYRGDRIQAVGHNGRTLNVDRWWLVEFLVGEDLTYGWIHSSVVEEISEISCASLSKAPGS